MQKGSLKDSLDRFARGETTRHEVPSASLILGAGLAVQLKAATKQERATILLWVGRRVAQLNLWRESRAALAISRVVKPMRFP